MLEIKDLRVKYGGIVALDGISMKVPEGKIITLVGANGAGKSTTLRSITKLVTPASGSITYDGKELTHKNTQDIVKMGITLVPEGRHVFDDMTVDENLMIGAYLRKDKENFKKDIAFIHEMFPRLKERAKQLSGTLSGGEQQMVAVGRALMSNPKVMMMDEPSLGLAPLVIKDIFDIIQKVNKEKGMTILLIEQNANAALKIADYGYVMETGKIRLEGTGQELLANEQVKELYLGKSQSE
ncbi:MAG: ABC transporter ATP-binding protein [Lachnospirales bacterium]